MGVLNMSEAIIELIVRCVFALAIIIYAILNKTSLSSVVKEIKEVTSMYKIRNKDGSITVVTEPTETVSEVVAAEPIEAKTVEAAEIKTAETVKISRSVPIAKTVEPVKEETVLEKAEKLVDSLTNEEAKQLFNIITVKLFK